ncbi:Germin-like protein subfamily 1 member 17 [Glycine soja]|uniref:Germin-like protein n=1 Tax=Glycine soja TaxID=3848 RepID=A0A445LZF9_GLYSO|nr:hypothetical protein JHK86_000603 [Glycine max]RZC28709.1 Germin-like protein subfamily 1 member 17 [Glycine soja]
MLELRQNDSQMENRQLQGKWTTKRARKLRWRRRQCEGDETYLGMVAKEKKQRLVTMLECDEHDAQMQNRDLQVFVNGKFYKDLKLVRAEDFFRHVELGKTDNPIGSNVTQVFVDQLSRLNTLGLNAPHTHPRGTEILIVLEGTLYVGFVTSNQDGNHLFNKVLNKGDVFVFPIGLIDFCINVGYGNVAAIVGLSS